MPRLGFLLIALVLISHPAAALTGTARIIDGDTLAIGETRIRLFGIDAPEGKQRCADALGVAYDCGSVARQALEAMTAGRSIECKARDLDRYGRTVATCEAAGLDLGGELVTQGVAVAYARYSKRYLPQQAAAQAAKRGLWAGVFVMPWDWRRERRSP